MANMTLLSDIQQAELSINTMPRIVFDQLCAMGKIDETALYFIDDEVYDMFNKRVVNVDDPVNKFDAVNLNYLSDYYVHQAEMSKYVDNTKLYNADKTQYIDEDLNKYKLDYSPWETIVIKGNFSANDVQVVWNPSTSSGIMNGYNLVIKGKQLPTGEYSQDSIAIHVTGQDSALGGEYEVTSTRNKVPTIIDSYLSKTAISACLSSIELTSSVDTIAKALYALRLKTAIL